MKIPLSIPHIGNEEIEEVAKVLKSGWIVHGPKTEEFERAFAEYTGVRYASACNSCASALQLAIEGLGIRGDILVPSMTMAASANAIVKAGARPVFVDIDPDTFDMDPSDLEKKMTPEAAAVMPVHYAGLACNMPAIINIARQKRIYIIEDAAEAIGASIDGKKTGSFGVGCFSFYATKNMTTGEGGMITMDDPELKERIGALKSHGIAKSTFDREAKIMQWERNSVFAGYNFRMCDILAAIGLIQLKKLDRMNEQRILKARYYTDRLKDIPGVVPQKIPEGFHHVYQMFVIRLLDKSMDRNSVVLKLRENGIGASVHFDPPVHLQDFYLKNFRQRDGSLKNTEELYKRIITLPLYPDIQESQIDYVTDQLARVLR